MQIGHQSLSGDGFVLEVSPYDNMFAIVEGLKACDDAIKPPVRWSCSVRVRQVAKFIAVCIVRGAKSGGISFLVVVHMRTKIAENRWTLRVFATA